MDKMKILHTVDDKETRDCFIDALRVLMTKKSYEKITIKELCEQANFSRKTFYDNFKKKDDLLDYLSDNLLYGYCYTDDHTNLLHFFEFCYALKDWIHLLIEQNLWGVVVEKTLKKYLPLLDGRDWEGKLGEHVAEQEMIFQFTAAGCFRLLRLWDEDGFNKTPKEMAALANHIVKNILVNNSKEDLQ